MSAAGSRIGKGWLPTAVGFDPRPPVLSQALVHWMEFGSTPLTEPFFDHTVKKLRAAAAPAREIETDLATMLRIGGRLPAIRPAGFIFHISRCGSTLLSNALKSSNQALVVSESGAITSLLLPQSSGIGPYLSARWDETRRESLNALFSLFAHYSTDAPTPLIIKFVSLNILCMRVVRSYWPDVPCVVVIRDPAEVIVASIQGGGWMTLKASPEVAREVFSWTDLAKSPVQMTDEEYSARVLGRYFRCALESLDEKCMVVDYEDLNAKRMREIAAFFKIQLPAESESLDRVFRVYAKDPSGRMHFKDDRKEKQRLASSQVRGAARQWAMPAYNDLRAR